MEGDTDAEGQQEQSWQMSVSSDPLLLSCTHHSSVSEAVELLGLVFTASGPCVCCKICNAASESGRAPWQSDLTAMRAVTWRAKALSSMRHSMVFDLASQMEGGERDLGSRCMPAQMAPIRSCLPEEATSGIRPRTDHLEPCCQLPIFCLSLAAQWLGARQLSCIPSARWAWACSLAAYLGMPS